MNCDLDFKLVIVLLVMEKSCRFPSWQQPIMVQPVLGCIFLPILMPPLFRIFYFKIDRLCISVKRGDKPLCF